MLAFKKQGHEVISLSQAPGKFIHPYLSNRGIETVSYVLNSTGLFYYLRNLIFFVKFCRKRKVNIVYSHLESANVVASVGQYFIRAKVFLCRHHIDEAALQGFDKSVLYRMTYVLARKIVTVSERSVKYMIEVEKIKKSKIVKINLGYDFELYDPPDALRVKAIRDEYSTSFLLVTISRLNAFKRPELSILVLKKLIELGVDSRLLILGTGPDEARLNNLVKNLQLEGRVTLTGYVTNVVDYIQASDVIVHPSVLESSCVVVKEAGLLRKPVIVCREIGDFDDYLVHNTNAFCLPVDPDSFVHEAVEILSGYPHNKEKLNSIGNELNKTITSLFQIESVMEHHTKLIHS